MEKAKLKVSLTLIKKYTIRLDINTLAELNPKRSLGRLLYFIFTACSLLFFIRRLLLVFNS